MTTKAWITARLGTEIKYNKSTPEIQCVDLAKSFCAETDTVCKGGVYKKYPELKKLWAWGNAIDWYTKPNAYTKALFDFLPADTVPKAGDLVIFQSGKYGHIAVAVGINDNTDILTIDQNWSGIKRAQIYKHGRRFIVGVLRAKGEKK